MFNFGIKDDNTKVHPQQCSHSHQSHCNCHHHHHPTPPSCCVSTPSCCRSSAPPQCCQSKSSSHSTSSCHIPCPPWRPATCPCTGSTKGPSSQGYYWRDFIPGEIPHDAVAGIDQKYVGQVSYNGAMLPVTIHTDKNTAVGERSGRRTFTKNIKILCSADPTSIYWEHVNYPQVTNEQMKHAVKGGHQDGYNVYIGVAYHEGEWKIGKVLPKENASTKGLQLCNDSGICVVLSEFHILKYKSNTPRRQVAWSNKKVDEIKKKNQQDRSKQFHEQRKQDRRNGHFKGRGLTDEKVRQDFYWRDYNAGEIPHDAIKGTNDLYIGQVSYDSCSLPATIYPSHNLAITEKNGKQVIKKNIKILCSPDASKFYWERHPSIFANHSFFDSQLNRQRQQGLLFGVSTNQVSNITGPPQIQSTTFGTSNKQGSSTSGMHKNLRTGSSGPQQAQTTTTFGTPAGQSGSVFGSPRNQPRKDLKVQKEFVFGATQTIELPNQRKQTDGIHFKEEIIHDNKDSKILEITIIGTAQLSEATTRESSQNVKTTGNSQIIKPVISFASTQNQDVTVRTPEGTSSGQLQDHNKTTEKNDKVNDQRGDFESTKSERTNTFEDGASRASGTIQGITFRCAQTQDETVQMQGTPSVLGQSQVQGTAVVSGQPDTQSSSVQFGQQRTQGTSTSFSPPQSQETSSNFDQPQTQKTATAFCQPDTQGGSAHFDKPRIQGSSFGFGQPQSKGSSSFSQLQTQGTGITFGSAHFGQPKTQRSSAPFAQSQSQGTSSLFGQSQTQECVGSVYFGNNQGNITTVQSLSSQEIIKEAIKGGHQDGLNLYIGKAFHEGEWKIGKVMRVNGFNKTLYVWGRFNETIALSEFEMLKYRSN